MTRELRLGGFFFFAEDESCSAIFSSDCKSIGFADSSYSISGYAWPETCMLTINHVTRLASAESEDPRESYEQFFKTQRRCLSTFPGSIPSILYPNRTINALFR